MRRHLLALAGVVILVVAGGVLNAVDATTLTDKNCTALIGSPDDPVGLLWSIPVLNIESEYSEPTSVAREEQPALRNTPAPPAPKAMRSVGERGVRALPRGSVVPSEALRGLPGAASSGAVVVESQPTDLADKKLAVERLDRVGRERFFYPVPKHTGLSRASRASTEVTSGQTCVEVILNPQMDVVQTPDGPRADPWVFAIGAVYYTEEAYYSPIHSILMMDETNGSDQVPSDGWDYDQFGQAFDVPSNLSSMTIRYQRAYLNANDTDEVWSNIWLLDEQGYLLGDPLAYRLIGADSGTWGGRQWELGGAELAQASGRTVALVFDMLSDRTGGPSGSDYDEVIFLDDAQVEMCWERGAKTVYLPMIGRQLGGSAGPTCVPREPDSITQMGKTAVGAMCGGSFNSIDEKDYYDLNLTTTSRTQDDQANIPIRLRLFSLPNGTNWDAMIYENVAGYPLPCQIGTPGDGDKHANCTLDSNKDYFVLVSRGPEQNGGTYEMSVTRR